MDPITFYHVPHFFQPAAYSAVGIVSIKATRDEPLGILHLIADGLPLQAMELLCLRIYYTIRMLFAACMDFLVWTTLTLSGVGIRRVGLKNHVENLIATIATPFFAITSLFGCYREITVFRTNLFSIEVNLITAIFNQEVNRIAYLVPRTRMGLHSVHFATYLPNHGRSIAAVIACGLDPNCMTVPNPDERDVGLPIPHPLVYATLIKNEENMEALIANGSDPNALVPYNPNSPLGERVTLISHLFFRFMDNLPIYFLKPASDILRREYPFIAGKFRKLLPTAGMRTNFYEMVESIVKLIENGAYYLPKDLEETMALLPSIEDQFKKLNTDQQYRDHIREEIEKLSKSQREGLRINSFTLHCLFSFQGTRFIHRLRTVTQMDAFLKSVHTFQARFIAAQDKSETIFAGQIGVRFPATIHMAQPLLKLTAGYIERPVRQVTTTTLS